MNEQRLASVLRAGSGVPFHSVDTAVGAEVVDALQEVDLLETFLSGFLSRSSDGSAREVVGQVDQQFKVTRAALVMVPERDVERRLQRYVDSLFDAYTQVVAASG